MIKRGNFRCSDSQRLKEAVEAIYQNQDSYSNKELDSLLQAVVKEKILLARDHLWDYCELLSPDFYKDDRPHLMELATLLGFLLQGKLVVPKYITQEGAQMPTEDSPIELPVGAIWHRFMMNMPPQHGKSRTLTNMSAWRFGNNNKERILLASYSDEPAIDFSKYTRDAIREEKLDETNLLEVVYSDIFPATCLKRGSATSKQWALEGQHFNYKGGGVGGSFTSKGATLQIIDDPIKNAEEALSEKKLNRAWNFITGTFMSRVSAEGGELIEILNMTRWAEKDPCGHHLEGKEQIYLGDTPFNIDGQDYYFPHLWAAGEWLLVKMAVMNEDGEMLCPAIFGKKRYKQLEESMPEGILQANYFQKPIDIKGRLFPKGALGYFSTTDFEEMKAREEFDGVITWGDVADDGDDSLSMPLGYMKGDCLYIPEVVFTKKGVQETSYECADQLLKHQVKIAYFESNNGGKTFALLVDKAAKETSKMLTMDYDTHIDWRANWQNKETRIYMESAYILRHVKFLHPSEYTKISDYGRFMEEIWTFNYGGQNEHDDAPDSIHGLVKLFQAILKKTEYKGRKNVQRRKVTRR